MYAKAAFFLFAFFLLLLPILNTDHSTIHIRHSNHHNRRRSYRHIRHSTP